MRYEQSGPEHTAGSAHPVTAEPGASADILNLEWSSKGRDIDIVEPVLSYLEIREGLRIERSSILDFAIKLFTSRAKTFVISNEIGAAENFLAVKLAQALGMHVVSLVSEGDLDEDQHGVEQSFWGWNADRVFYEDLHLEWSQRAVDLIHQFIPGSEEFNIQVSGATGFDRYRFMPFSTKVEFLERHGKPGFKRVLGFAAWGFDALEGAYFERFSETVLVRVGGQDALEMHRRARRRVNAILGKLVEANPETLFVLKFHPGNMDESLTEFAGLSDRPNVLAVRGRAENISDVISACDAWFAYESTTCLEAWMLGKQTMLLNPERGDFKRSRIAAGSPIVRTYEELSAAIDEFYATGALPGFEELSRARAKAESEVIGWPDGRNHERAANYILEALERPAPPRKVDVFALRLIVKAWILRIMRVLGLLRVGPFKTRFASQLFLEAAFDPEERENQHRAYLAALREFHGLDAR